MSGVCYPIVNGDHPSSTGPPTLEKPRKGDRRPVIAALMTLYIATLGEAFRHRPSLGAIGLSVLFPFFCRPVSNGI